MWDSPTLSSPANQSMNLKEEMLSPERDGFANFFFIKYFEWGNPGKISVYLILKLISTNEPVMTVFT